MNIKDFKLTIDELEQVEAYEIATNIWHGKEHDNLLESDYFYTYKCVENIDEIRYVTFHNFGAKAYGFGSSALPYYEWRKACIKKIHDVLMNGEEVIWVKLSSIKDLYCSKSEFIEWIGSCLYE